MRKYRDGKKEKEKRVHKNDYAKHSQANKIAAKFAEQDKKGLAAIKRETQRYRCAAYYPDKTPAEARRCDHYLPQDKCSDNSNRSDLCSVIAESLH